jgi:quinol-cytochrome oxidoreductase complex cytochrome b subunit
MKVNKRLLIESVIVSIVIVLVVLGWGIVRGNLLTKNYVPDIVDSYKTTDYLQHEVSFGFVNRSNWITVLMGLCGFLFVVITYYGIRVWLSKMIKKNRVPK